MYGIIERKINVDLTCNKTMRIILYDDQYKSQMLSMITEARIALGLSPSIREDLYDVKANYLDKGDMFWLAIEEDNSVIGCLGYSRINKSNEAFLHRFYVKASRKHQGIGTALLFTAEKTMKNNEITVSRVHLGASKEQWFESYAFYPKNGYEEYEPRYMIKHL